jgi:hypothetical protein
MENLPEEVQRRIVREAEPSGVVSQAWQRYMVDHDWVIQVPKTADLDTMIFRMRQTGAKPDIITFVLDGVTQPFPEIPKDLRENVTKITVINKGTYEVKPREGFFLGTENSQCRKETPLPLHWFDGSWWPALEKLIAPSHAVPRGEHPMMTNGIRVLEIFAEKDKPRAPRMDQALIALCPNLETLRFRCEAMASMHSVPTHLQAFWFKTERWASGYRPPTDMPGFTFSLGLIIDPTGLVELVLDDFDIYRGYLFAWQTHPVFPSLRRVCIRRARFANRHRYNEFRALFPNADQWVEKDVTIDNEPEPEPQSEPSSSGGGFTFTGGKPPGPRQ